jgi:hypothetical protein
MTPYFDNNLELLLRNGLLLAIYMHKDYWQINLLIFQ